MRSTSSVVLPVPAPASRTRLVAWSGRARRARLVVDRAEAHPHVPQAQVALQPRVAQLVAAGGARSGPWVRTPPVKSQKSQALGSCRKSPARDEASTRSRSSARKALPRHALGIEGHLPAAVDVVEEGLDHRLAREELRRGQDVEGDLELPAAAEEAAVVLRGARPVL